jgi:hypothetical protein
MRCEEAQNELAREQGDAVVPGALAAHLASCPTCENVRRLYGRIDVALTQGAVWEPPVEFGRRVAASALRTAPHRVADRRIVSPGVFDLVMPGLFVAATGYIAGVASDVLIMDAVPMTWLCAALSLWVGASFTHRVIRLRDLLP